MRAVHLHAKDDDVTQPAKDLAGGLRVGHVFLDTRRRRLVCLNETAREFHEQQVPLAPADLKIWPLQNARGQPVRRSELPLVIAWRSEKPAEAQFLLPRGDKPAWRIAWAATPLRDREGKLLGVVATVTCAGATDNPQRLAELAHDLRTPLQSLRLLCALIERMPHADAEMKNVMEAIRAVADRAVQIALELLDACRGPVGKIGAHEIPWFPLEPLLAGLAAEQTVAAQEKNLTLTRDFTAVQGWEIRCDRARLGRVLSNILVNAVRYTPRGRVNFAAGWQEKDGHRSLEISVADTGPGISDEEQESIFQPFERGRAGKRAGDSSGSGLGLAVVDRLVEELGLTLDVYSEYGRGSAFHLLVPGRMLRPADRKN
jgi:signal transduction histidine kinase